MEEQVNPSGARAHPQVKVFIEGRYRKHSRDLPQTVFFCPDCKGHPRRKRECARCEGFGKLTRDSVQELIGWVVGSAFKTRKNKFHGAGREDVNVRMLGGGRPFVMEIVAPKIHDVDLAAVEAEINRRNAGRLEVVGLHWTEKARVRVVKEEKHAKEYRALVEVQGAYELSAVRELFGLYQAIFMANAGGAWDNAKKIVETELKAKGTDLHAATVVGDTVGDPFKDTSSVALNPIIKFTTLFGLLAVELAVSLTRSNGAALTMTLAGVFLLVSMFFVYRSFYGMRIQ
jgi:hypothetical protein